MDVSSFLKTFKKKATQRSENSAGGPTRSLPLTHGREESEGSSYSNDAESGAESNPDDGDPLEKPHFSIAMRQTMRYQRQGLKKNQNYDLEPLKVISDHEGSNTSANGIYSRRFDFARAVQKRPGKPHPRDESADAYWKDLLQERQKLKRLSEIDVSTAVEPSACNEEKKASLEDRLVSVEKLLSSSENNPSTSIKSGDIMDILAFLPPTNNSTQGIGKTYSNGELPEAMLNEKVHNTSSTDETVNSTPNTHENPLSDQQPTISEKKRSMFQRAKALSKKI
ncbi:unnamed protein product [Phytomonas sp. EM1]|nr:unnamed protein product [Phytomonas sp. EM1]|eukprot:CCW64077.1 unnamed protein product [Phytomonas sp. isolate EM1]